MEPSGSHNRAGRIGGAKRDIDRIESKAYATRLVKSR
jgi:hypothetical protein